MDINFYILSVTDELAAWQSACSLIEQAYQAKTPTFIYTASVDAAMAFDNLLWTYRDDIFLPHTLFAADATELIQIGHPAALPATPNGSLMNLANENIPRYAEFSSVTEIVYQDPSYQAKARERFKFYRDQGHQLHTHKLI